MFDNNQPQNRFQEVQSHFCDLIRMVARKTFHAVVCVSDGGFGKSFCVQKTLEEEGQDYVVYNSHCTSLQFFRILWENSTNGKVCVLDDCEGILKQDASLGLLRSALFGNPNRLVTWNSTSLPRDLPDRFETTSRFIILANSLPKGPIMQAILTRTLFYRMELSNEDILAQFRVMSEQGFNNCSAEQAEEIIDFIEENSLGKRLSMRMLSPAIRIYTHCAQNNRDWRKLLLTQMSSYTRPAGATKRLDSAARDERIVREALRKFPESTADACRFFQERSSKSRASYFRVLKRVKAESE